MGWILRFDGPIDGMNGRKTFLREGHSLLMVIAQRLWRLSWKIPKDGGK